MSIGKNVSFPLFNSRADIGYRVSTRIRPTNASESVGNAMIFAAPMSRNFPLAVSLSVIRASSTNTFKPVRLTREPNLVETIRRASFPEIMDQHDEQRRQWFESYITTILQRDVRQIADIEKPVSYTHLTLPTKA